MFSYETVEAWILVVGLYFSAPPSVVAGSRGNRPAFIASTLSYKWIQPSRCQQPAHHFSQPCKGLPVPSRTVPRDVAISACGWMKTRPLTLSSPRLHHTRKQNTRFNTACTPAATSRFLLVYLPYLRDLYWLAVLVSGRAANASAPWHPRTALESPHVKDAHMYAATDGVWRRVTKLRGPPNATTKEVQNPAHDLVFSVCVVCIAMCPQGSADGLP